MLLHIDNNNISFLSNKCGLKNVKAHIKVKMKIVTQPPTYNTLVCPNI